MEFVRDPSELIYDKQKNVGTRYHEAPAETIPSHVCALEYLQVGIIFIAVLNAVS